MSAEPIGMVAWNNGRGFTLFHLERLNYPGSLLCPAVPPTDARFDRRADIGGGDLCQNCVTALDEQTARNLKVLT